MTFAQAFRQASSELEIADRAWNKALIAEFGKHGGETQRYTQDGQGAPGTSLHTAWLARRNAFGEWHNAKGDLRK